MDGHCARNVPLAIWLDASETSSHESCGTANIVAEEHENPNRRGAVEGRSELFVRCGEQYSVRQV